MAQDDKHTDVLSEIKDKAMTKTDGEPAAESSQASTPLSDHDGIEPQPDRGTIAVTFTRHNPKHDPYVAAVSEDAYMPPHHMLTLTSRATRFGQSVYHAGARSFNQHGGKPGPKKEANASEASAQKGSHSRNRSAGDGFDRASIRTVVSVHLPRWMNDFTARRSHQQSILPLLSFHNPWSSFRPPGIATAIRGGLRWGLPQGYVEGGRHKSRYRTQGRTIAQTEEDRKTTEVRVIKPTWDRHTEEQCKQNIRITWLGHATTLVQLPNGLNILFDPIFVQRASPSQSAGPHRFTDPPCKVEDLPDIDIVCISHNHYDHLSWECMKKLRKRQKLRGGLKVFCALGNVGFFREAGFDSSDVCEMDWWDSAKVERPQWPGDVQIVCTPAQHGSGRSTNDQNISLWASWLICYKDAETSSSQRRIFFAGDTGLRSRTSARRDRNEYPACPLFREISLQFGVPDVLLLPISVGSSLSYFRSWDPFPRRFSPFPRVESAMTSAIHMDAEDAAECHAIMSLAKDDASATQKARTEDAKRPASGPTSIAVHFGTFVRNEEQTRYDVRDLKRACLERKIKFVRPVEDEATAIDGSRMTDAKAKDEGTKTDEKADSDRERGRFLVTHQGQTIFIPLI